MSKRIQIRHVPERIHRTLKAKATTAGKSLSDYLLAEIERIAELPTIEEWAERIWPSGLRSGGLRGVSNLRRRAGLAACGPAG